MITLGLNAAFHDSAAALVKDGVLLAAAEEERFNRVRHAKRSLPFTAWELPFHAIASCLEQAGLTLADVDHVAYSFDPWRFAEGRADLPLDENACLPIPLAPELRRSPALAAWDSPWDPLFLATVINAPGQLANGAPQDLKRRLLPAGRTAKWQWQFLDHALCHQASAFLASPFQSCAVLTLDGRGERATTSYGVWNNQRYRPLGEVEMPHSLGGLYAQVTRHLGFPHAGDDDKVMSLAAMGRPRWGQALADHVHVKSDGRFSIETVDLEALAGPPREPGSPLMPAHFDLAASMQQVLEGTVLKLAGWLREISGQSALALAGSVALNCRMNSRLRDEGPFEALWIQPAAGDAGTALGAALWADATARAVDDRLPARAWEMDHAFHGPAWSDDDIEPLLRWAGLSCQHVEDEAELLAQTAALLANQRIIGWFQGRMEWGPRALGARSILASPLLPGMQQRLNDLKDREDFRPAAPAITAEAFADWFTPAHANGGRSPFMLFTHQVVPHQARRIPSACHRDGSARVQTVHAQTQPRFHALLQAFGRRTGVPVLINTSFNGRGEPIVCTPKHALDAFFTSPLDALVIGSFILRKPGVS